jgi:hypothetical protein
VSCRPRGVWSLIEPSEWLTRVESEQLQVRWVMRGLRDCSVSYQRWSKSREREQKRGRVERKVERGDRKGARAPRVSSGRSKTPNATCPPATDFTMEALGGKPRIRRKVSVW